jgi:RimJ/RimL family protein N-acetyltransferase
VFAEDPVAAQPELGPRVDWHPVAAPARAPIAGTTVRLEPLDPERHTDDLWEASHGYGHDASTWDYMGYGPFDGVDEFRGHIQSQSESSDPLFFAIVEAATGTAQGVASYLRIVPKDGVIEIGHIWFGAALQRTRQATEAIFLLAGHAFDDLGYRRLEWKCNALNARSRAAAARFGFTYEGTFRQHMITKGRNRDTAWFSIIDGEWPGIRDGFRRWLAAENFDEAGRQRASLQALRRAGGDGFGNSD